jgi:hypothetical protein
MVRSLSVGAFRVGLVFSPILRTRSARKILVDRSVIVLLLLVILVICGAVGCKDQGPSREVPELPRAAGAGDSTVTSDRMKRELAALAAEAGIDPPDPLPPTGNLKRDIESFASLDACVREHQTTDPVLVDAIDSFTYDTLTRDACRVLQALKAKDQHLCKEISSYGLRSRCEVNVAVLVGDPRLCPITGVTKEEARDPVCLARANRDERYCGALYRYQRPICSAIVTGNVADCGKDQSCVRQVGRWSSLLEKPDKHSDLVSRVHAELTPEEGTPELVDRSFEFKDDAAGGAIIRIGGDGARLSFGRPRSAHSTPWDASYAQPEIYAELLGSAGDPTKGAAPLTATKLEVLVPKVGMFTALSDHRVIDVSRWSQEPGGSVKLKLKAEIGDGARRYSARIEVETFIRDVIDVAQKNEEKHP